MPQYEDFPDAALEEAVELARNVGDGLGTVLLTHYSDAETLDTFRPGETDIEAVQRTNRAVAVEMLDRGVEIIVQRADRAAFRRWMQGRADTPENRLAWIDRDRLIRGDAALRLLGLDPGGPPAKPRFGRQPGPVAEGLLAAFVAGEEDELRALVEDLLVAGREDVLDLAVRKAAERHGYDNAQELADALRAVAAGAAAGPSGWAELVALPVALPQGHLPDAVDLAERLVASGALNDTLELRFLRGWYSPRRLAGLSPGTLRRVLLDMIARAEPDDLLPGDTDELLRGGFGVLVGLQVDWDIPVWDVIVAQGGLPPDEGEEGEETAEEARAAALYDSWRGAVFEVSGGCVPLELVTPTEVRAEIERFLDEAGTQTRGLERIVACIAAARREAGDEDVVCRAEIVGEGLELSLYTERGRFLDSLTLPERRLPAKAVEMPAVLGTFVRMVRDAPGR